MAVKAGDLELELIDVLSACVAERLPEESADSYAEFVRQYYHWVPAQDLRDRNPLDLCGAVAAHWRAAKHREPGEAKVSVYNPDIERDGWHSPYTVVADRVRRHAVHRRLGDDGAEPAGYAIELIVHPVMRVVRDGDGRADGDAGAGAASADGLVIESVIHAEVARQADPERAGRAAGRGRAGARGGQGRGRRLGADARPRRRAGAGAARGPPPISAEELRRGRGVPGVAARRQLHVSRLPRVRAGAMRGRARPCRAPGWGSCGAPRPPHQAPRPSRALELARSPHALVLTKANSRATIHRPAYLDYMGVKRFGPDGDVIGERRFLGLYTTIAYKTSPREIPMLREKVERGAGPRRVPARQPRRQGHDRHPRVAAP